MAVQSTDWLNIKNTFQPCSSTSLLCCPSVSLISAECAKMMCSFSILCTEHKVTNCDVLTHITSFTLSLMYRNYHLKPLTIKYFSSFFNYLTILVLFISLYIFFAHMGAHSFKYGPVQSISVYSRRCCLSPAEFTSFSSSSLFISPTPLS